METKKAVSQDKQKDTKEERQEGTIISRSRVRAAGSDIRRSNAKCAKQTRRSNRIWPSRPRERCSLRGGGENATNRIAASPSPGGDDGQAYVSGANKWRGAVTPLLFLLIPAPSDFSLVLLRRHHKWTFCQKRLSSVSSYTAPSHTTYHGFPSAGVWSSGRLPFGENGCASTLPMLVHPFSDPYLINSAAQNRDFGGSSKPFPVPITPLQPTDCSHYRYGASSAAFAISWFSRQASVRSG